MRWAGMRKRNASSSRYWNSASCPGHGWAWRLRCVGQQQMSEAEAFGQSLIDDFPEFIAAYDFLAEVREEVGQLTEAQEVLQTRSNDLAQQLDTTAHGWRRGGT
jgi:hypothetical protein